ncbi:hypothetical protein [Caballeronia telluris]|uniref:hypothetical protein n=1 Tax=Caballeronia telluris TaxID=326475 RepID=UPI000F740876|nr:hypothetical protein [Caballeronia telluris]
MSVNALVMVPNATADARLLRNNQSVRKFERSAGTYGRRRRYYFSQIEVDLAPAFVSMPPQAGTTIIHGEYETASDADAILT